MRGRRRDEEAVAGVQLWDWDRERYNDCREVSPWAMGASRRQADRMADTLGESAASCREAAALALE